jgi:hypothetical protein
MSKLIITIFSFSLLVLSGCETIHKEGMDVQIVHKNELLDKKCSELSGLASISFWSSGHAMAKIRNQAGSIGATHLVLTEQLHNGIDIQYKAQAFKCELTASNSQNQI